MTDEEYLKHFDTCFRNKKDSYYKQYVSILNTYQIRLPKNPKNIQKETKDLIQSRGYEKWKIIPRPYFQNLNLPKEYSDHYLNTVFLPPKYYFKASYVLMLYFQDKNDTLCKFFKDRLYRIFMEMDTEETRKIPDSVKKYLYYKTKEKIILTEEDYQIIQKLFLNHYKGRQRPKNKTLGKQKETTLTQITEKQNDS